MSLVPSDAPNPARIIRPYRGLSDYSDLPCCGYRAFNCYQLGEGL